jgi:GAF domain-containing protein
MASVNLPLHPETTTFSGFVNEARLLCHRLADTTLGPAEFLATFARLTNRAIPCSRSGVWIFTGPTGSRSLRCLAMYDATANGIVSIPDDDCEMEPYFEALEARGYIVADDVQHHAATAALFERRLRGQGVCSLLVSSFAVNGSPFGVASCAQLGQRRQWTRRELALLRNLGAQASVALHTGYGEAAARKLTPAAPAPRRSSDGE